MELLAYNLANVKTRRKTLNGREHLIVPMTMIVPGVLGGSRGALYYPPDEVKKHPSIWNSMPIVVEHPRRDGQPVSARSPDILNSVGIGFVMEATVNEEGKLIAEGWFDIDKTRQVDIRILNRLNKGDPVELSTGLYTDNEESAGTYEGKAYTHIARNYRPDHVAILPDDIGACSLDDGCGVLVNQQVLILRGPKKGKRATVVNIRGDRVQVKMRDGSQAMTLATNVALYKPSKRNDTMPKLSTKQRKELVDGLISNCDCEVKGPWTEEDSGTLNEFTDEKLQTLYDQAELVANSNEEKKNKVHPLSEEQMLKGMDDDKLEAEMKKRMAGKKTASENERKLNEVKPLSEDEWMKQAPDSIKSVVRNMQEFETQQKKECVKTIVANKLNQMAEEFLMTKDLKELQALAVMAAGSSENVQGGDHRFISKPNYSGAAGGVTSNSADDDLDQDDILGLPTINWAEEVANRKTG